MTLTEIKKLHKQFPEISTVSIYVKKFPRFVAKEIGDTCKLYRPKDGLGFMVFFHKR